MMQFERPVANRTGVRDFMFGLPDVVDAHIRDVAEGVGVANGFIPVHIDAMELIRRNAIEFARNDTALILLGTHVLNVYTSVLELAVRGRFDVAWHLVRAMFDGRSLAYAVARDEALAARFMQDQLKASSARKFALEDLAATGYSDITGGLADRWARNADASNTLAHVNVSHLGMLVAAQPGELIPHYGGREDARACRLVFASVHEEELWFLTILEHLRKSALPEQWSHEFLTAKVAFSAFRERYESEWIATGV